VLGGWIPTRLYQDDFDSKGQRVQGSRKKDADISHTAMTQFLEFDSGIPPMPEVVIILS
jgi:hypothetical protein